MTYAALALAVLAFLLALAKGKRLAKLEEELSRMKALEYSYRELRKDLDAKLQITRQHLALVSGGKKLPADAIMSGKPPEDLAGDDEILQTIKATIEGHKIAIFMKGTPEAPQCGFSAGVVDLFNEMKVPFVGVNAVAQPKFRTVLSQFSNWPTLPQVFVAGKLIGGADIVKEMKASGELDKVVREALGTPAGA